MDLTPIQPVAAIIGAIITATAAAGVTYFLVVKRKLLKFWVSKSEELTKLLRRDKWQMSVKINDRELENLNRATVAVVNEGNSAIADLHFVIVIEGEHKNRFAESAAGNPELENAIQVKWDQPPATKIAGFFVTVPFFNRGELLRVIVFYDGPTSDCSIRCRMEDVHVKVQAGYYMSPRETFEGIKTHWALALAIVVLSSIVLTGAFRVSEFLVSFLPQPP